MPDIQFNEKDLEYLALLEETPLDSLREINGTTEIEIQKALSASANIQSGGTVPDIDVNPDPGTEASPSAEFKPDMSKYKGGVKEIPPEKVSFKFSELMDAELAVMLFDMLISWGGEAFLVHVARKDVDREELQANEFQKNALVKAWSVAFNKWTVSTDNPIYAVLMVSITVYGMNIGDAMRRKGKIDKPRDKAKYAKPEKPKNEERKKRDFQAEYKKRKEAMKVNTKNL